MEAAQVRISKPLPRVGLRHGFRRISALEKPHENQGRAEFVLHFPHLSHIIRSPERLILRTRIESVSIDQPIDGMDIAELKAELETLHSASFGWALNCCRRDWAEAEEVLQTVYLKILEGKACFRGEASLRTWLFAVIRKTAISEHRKNVLRKLRWSDCSQQTPVRVSAANQPAQALERSETQVLFQNALKSLPRRQREALHLVFYQDLTLSEAAVVMGISIGSARQHYERGKKHLRESLGQTEIAYGNSWRGKENPGAV